MIRCQICKKLFKQLQMHLKTHGITVEEYKKKYNVKHVVCRLMRNAIGERSVGNKYAEGYIFIKEQIERHSKRMLGNDYVLEYAQSKRGREKSRIRMIQQCKDGKMGGRCKMYLVENHIGKEVKVQGKYEVKFVELLTKVGIRWKRPKPKIYLLDGEEHYYFCDFWLPDERLYVEVKSRYYYNKHKKEVKAKKRMMVEGGERKRFRYKIMFEEDMRDFELNVGDVAETLIRKQNY